MPSVTFANNTETIEIMSDRHRADDDIEAVASGSSYRTSNGESDLLDASSASLNSTASSSSKRSTRRSSSKGEGNTRQARLEARLAKRTSKVMNAYKDYLSQIETNASNALAKAHKGDVESHGNSVTSSEVGGRTPFQDYGFKPTNEFKTYKDDGLDDGNPFPSQDEYKDGLIQRKWTYTRENSRDPPEMQKMQEDTFLDYEDIRSKFGIEAEDNAYARNSPYKYPMLHSRRVKRGLALIAIAAVLIGVAVGVSSAKKKAALPDWEAELAEIEKEEQEKHLQKAQEEIMVHSKQEPPQVENDVEAAEAPKSESTESKVQEITVTNVYKEVVKKFSPISFDRSKGWDGTTYNDAVNFCNELKDHTLCPYQAVCPFGPNSKPSGGYQTIGSWLAISNEENGWVHLGSVDSCAKYEDTNQNDTFVKPRWGMSGNEKATKNIMCCKITDDSPKATIAKEEVESASDDDDSIEAGKVSTVGKEESTAIKEESPLVGKEESAIVQNTPEIAPLTAEEVLQIKLVSDKLQPIYYNRSHGWGGQTYAAAIEFCASKESRVPCPYTAVCPNGKGRPPLGGIHENKKEGSFVPIIDSPNQWVELSSRGVCELYSSLFGSPPEWGLTGEGNEDITTNILCCKEPIEDTDEGTSSETSQQAQAESASKAEDLDAEVYQVAAKSVSTSALTNAEQSVLDVMHPLWFGKKHGWHGTTYDDAVEFCKNVGGMSVCPLEGKRYFISHSLIISNNTK
jgi:hypothetical protein